jgi:formylglycine-generating enzyme required for sulfatase activity/dienelactone hydrolase
MDETDLVGQTISHYRITERLGGGGMGLVYKAVDVRLNRFVALKFLSASLTKDPGAKERFIQEAQAASALDHPNICTIHEIDETPDRELFLTMAYYQGETLKQRIERGALAIDEAVDVAVQITQALARAHGSGIVHRDIKPANLMLPKGGPVKIVDFGIAKLIGHSDITKTGTTVGTVAYMSPETIRGAEAGPAADVWAVGVVLYEMLTGRRPFEGKDDLAVISRILDHPTPPVGAHRPGLPDRLQRTVARALEKDVAKRYPSAIELLTDLQACRVDMTRAEAAPAPLSQILRRPLVVAAALVLLAIGAIPATIAYRRASRARWVRNEGIPGILRLVASDDYAGAFALAQRVDQELPNDPVLATLWPQFSVEASMATSPDGADVSMQPYGDAGGAWTPLGRTPITNKRLPRGVYRFQIEKAGFEPLLLASMNPGPLLGNLQGARRSASITMTLLPSGKSEHLVPVPGGSYPVGLSGFNSEVSMALDPFLIDRDEVTNQAFKRFVDAGGYAKSEWWSGSATSSRFVDSTGRPGPSTWELGEFPGGQAEYPVGGVSWHEAVAYCRSVGKTLPPVYNWARAALSPVEITSPIAPSIIPLSNFAGKGPVAVGSTRAIGPYGTHDMAGNVREWVWNETAGGRHWILGGAWGDPGYMFLVPNSLPPDDRAAANGFRCAQFPADKPLPDRLLARVDTFARDYGTAKPVSDEVFEVFKRQMAYVKAPLNERVESRDTSRPDWVREKITFDAGYENGRVTAYLFLPPSGGARRQLIVVFPGVPIGRSSSDGTQPNPGYDYIIKSGRAVVLPIYKGYAERWDPFLSLQGEDYLRTFRTRMAQWHQDIGNVLDILTARSDIDATKLGYLGLSFGGSTAFPVLPLEDRFKTAVLAPAGFTYRLMPPEADALNYVSRLKIPVLMIGGRHDYVFPLETSQKPMFERLGAPSDQKRHVIFDSGHTNFPRSETIREVLGWLDKYLGPVKAAG